MKAFFGDEGGRAAKCGVKIKIKVSKKKSAVVKWENDEVCGPFGGSHKVKIRACKHGFVHPNDWQWCDIGEMSDDDIAGYICPDGCFKLTVTKTYR